MKYSVDGNKFSASDELRSAFAELIQKEVAASDPALGAKIVFNKEPEQLRFNFTFSDQHLPK